LCTNKATYKLVHEILQSFSNNIDMSGIFCLAKAFDYVNHNILMTKLVNYGIG